MGFTRQSLTYSSGCDPARTLVQLLLFLDRSIFADAKWRTLHFYSRSSICQNAFCIALDVASIESIFMEKGKIPGISFALFAFVEDFSLIFLSFFYCSLANSDLKGTQRRLPNR